MKSKTKTDMYIAYANKILGTNHRSIITIRKKMQESNNITNLEFYYIIEEYFERVADKVIEGKTFKIPNVGYIFIEKKPRLKGSRKIDWKKSHQYKKELEEQGIELYNKETDKGEKWWFYIEEDYYLRWNLKRIGNPLVTKYIFKPTNSNPNYKRKDDKGNYMKPVLGTKGKLAKANHNNPNLHLVYISKLNNIR